jgi:hypothetical protein
MEDKEKKEQKPKDLGINVQDTSATKEALK